ncbi:MAG: 50S ribosomal protein L20, partial [Candidatus Roizmanbacteria bacterium]
TRVKGGVHTRAAHKKVLNLAKGYRMTKSKLFKVAQEAVLHAGEYAFAGRKMKKRQFRKLWIVRLNSAVREHGMKYSQFIKVLKDKKIDLDRKVLASMASEMPAVFSTFVKSLLTK